MSNADLTILGLTRHLRGIFNSNNVATVGHPVHSQLVSCLLNVETRYRSCELHSEIFTDLIQKHIEAVIANDDGQMDCYFEQDHNLFGFFFNGLSTLESAIYGLSLIVSLTYPIAFPIQPRASIPSAVAGASVKPMTFRTLKVKNVAERLKTVLPNDQLTLAIDRFQSEAQYLELCTIRNVLGHLGTPGREYTVVYADVLESRRELKSGGELAELGLLQLDALEANNGRICVPIDDRLILDLNAKTTADRLAWLTMALRDLLESGLQFVDEHHKPETWELIKDDEQILVT